MTARDKNDDKNLREFNENKNLSPSSAFLQFPSHFSYSDVHYRVVPTRNCHCMRNKEKRENVRTRSIVRVRLKNKRNRSLMSLIWISRLLLCLEISVCHRLFSTTDSLCWRMWKNFYSFTSHFSYPLFHTLKEWNFLTFPSRTLTSKEFE